MLDNKFALVVALVLFLGGVGYNVWFFFLQDDGSAGGGDQVVGSDSSGRPAEVAGGGTGGQAGGGNGGRPDSAVSGLDGLVRAAREGRLPVRPAPEVERALAAGSGQPRWGRDPLALPQPEQPAPEPEPAVQPPTWRLGAVMTGGDRNVAVINGQVYGEGDRIDGGTVVSVGAGRVVIRWRGRRVVLEPQ